MSDKGLLINAIGLVDVHGSTNIPTVLFYRKEGLPAIGSEALALKHIRRELNEDFKVDLGNLKLGSTTAKRLFPTATGGKKSAAELTGDFVHELLGHVTEWMTNRDLKKAPSIMVAEPLSMLAESSGEKPKAHPEESDSKQGELVDRDWLQNYRRNLKLILLGKGFNEDRIKFLPEPFAVFQYYRHGYRHPLVADRRKHNALVLDSEEGLSTFASLKRRTKERLTSTNRAACRRRGPLHRSLSAGFIAKNAKYGAAGQSTMRLANHRPRAC